MAVNKTILDRVIYRSTKKSASGTLIQDGLFETDEHGIDAITKTDFTAIDTKSLVVLAASNNEELMKNTAPDTVDDHFYMTVVASQLYHLLLNFVKIPTNKKITNNKTTLYVCSISLINPDEATLNRKAYSCLCFLGLPLNTDIVLEASVYMHLMNNFAEVLKLEVLSEHEVNYKFATMDKIGDDYELVSITRQENFAKRCKGIITYKQNNPDTNKDNTRLDNLQYHLIDQQLSFGLYLALEPVFDLCIAKFSRGRKLIDSTGNLFFSLSLAYGILENVDQVQFIDVVHTMIDYGFYMSHDDIQRNIKFTTGQTNIEHHGVSESLTEKREGDSKILGKNSMYSLLFRLLDESLADQLPKLDDLILGKKYAEFDAEILKILS